jgi:hypothetical protein
MAIGLLIYPGAYCVEHIAVDFQVFISQSRVVEYT